MGSELHLSMAKGADHTNFFDTDLGTSRGALSPQTTLGNLEDGNWHTRSGDMGCLHPDAVLLD